jgi:hypothetical protein
VPWMESPDPHGREETEPTAVNAAKSEDMATVTVAVVEAPACSQVPVDHARHVTGRYQIQQTSVHSVVGPVDHTILATSQGDT